MPPDLHDTPADYIYVTLQLRNWRCSTAGGPKEYRLVGPKLCFETLRRELHRQRIKPAKCRIAPKVPVRAAQDQAVLDGKSREMGIHHVVRA